MRKQLVTIRVNGRTHELALEPNRLLLDCLRQDLGLTGSKRGCDDSSCGACTVQVDGVPMLSCTLLAASLALDDDGNGPEIASVEGLADHGALSALQKAYGDWGGAQCGFCTPGFMCTVSALLADNPDPSDDEVRNALSSNLCRCTGYMQMYQAIRSAITAERQGRVASIAADEGR
jgi:carbon-monoxide dehydrogenase small subunit